MAITKTAQNMIQMGAGGTYSNARDAIRHQIWDTRVFGVAPSDYTFFSQPIGASWRGNGSKTKVETNLQDSGKLPNGQTILVTRISIAILSQYEVGSTGNSTFPNAAALAQAYVNVMQNSVFQIKVAGREFDFEVHGRQFLPALCINGAASNAARYGDTVVSGWIKLDPSPIFIDELVSFQVNHLITNGDPTNINASGKPLFNSCAWLAANYCTMNVTMDGFLTRAK